MRQLLVNKIFSGIEKQDLYVTWILKGYFLLQIEERLSEDLVIYIGTNSKLRRTDCGKLLEMTNSKRLAYVANTTCGDQSADPVWPFAPSYFRSKRGKFLQLLDDVSQRLDKR